MLCSEFAKGFFLAFCVLSYTHTTVLFVLTLSQFLRRVKTYNERSLFVVSINLINYQNDKILFITFVKNVQKYLLHWKKKLGHHKKLQKLKESCRKLLRCKVEVLSCSINFHISLLTVWAKPALMKIRLGSVPTFL